MRLYPDVSVFCVQLAQFFVCRRLDEPEAGNDAPAQGAGYEDTQRREEPAGENRDDSDQPDECQGEIEDGVVDADDEVFHGAYSLRDLKKSPSPGGGSMLSQCLHRSRSGTYSFSENIFVSLPPFLKSRETTVWR